LATTYDIARVTGLNQSTVSRVLSGRGKVQASTARKVRAACRKLGYVPNAAARALRTRRTAILAIHIPFGSETVLADPFTPIFLAGVSRAAAGSGYRVILSYADPEHPEIDFSELVKSGQADGLIITSPMRADPRVRTLVDQDIPCVLGRYVGRLGARMASVDIDNRHTGYISAKFLLSRGHRTIGLFTEHSDTLSALDFQTGFRQALTENKIRHADRLARPIPVTFDAAFQAARELLNEADPPTAMVADTALTVFGVLEAVRRSGRDVLVLGIDSPLLRSLHPDLPRIQSPIEELGGRMTQVLVHILQTGEAGSASKMLFSRIVDEHGNLFTEET